MDDIEQGLRKIGPQFSAVDDKRQRILRMIRNGQVKIEKQNPVRDNILGLKPKRLRKKPTSTRWYRPFFSYELNGILNWGVSMNYVRFMFPVVPMFYFFYVLLPVMHGVVYERQENNFQWESLYPKMGNDRLYYGEHTISRIA